MKYNSKPTERRLESSGDRALKSKQMNNNKKDNHKPWGKHRVVQERKMNHYLVIG